MRWFNNTPERRKQIIRGIAGIICETSLARSSVRQESLINFLKLFGVRTITQKDIEDCIKELLKDTLDDIYAMLRKSVCNTLVLDEWTNVVGNSVFNYVVINDVGDAYLVDVVDHGLQPNTTDNIAELTHNVIEELKGKGITITGLITDNCNSMKSLKQALCDKYPWNRYEELIKVGCCCHILAIMMKRIANLPFISLVLSSVNNNYRIIYRCLMLFRK